MLKGAVYMIMVSALILAAGAVDTLDEKGLSVKGSELYRLNCSACHGLDKKGIPPMFPSLENIGQRMNRRQVTYQIRTGKNAMPPLRHLSDKEVRTIVAYVLDNRDETVETGMKKRGATLVTANCLRCHRVKPGDPAPAETPGVEPPLLSHIVRQHNLAEFREMLNRGPCSVPSPEGISAGDKDDIYRFLNSIPVDSYFTGPAHQSSCMEQDNKNSRCGCGN